MASTEAALRPRPLQSSFSWQLSSATPFLAASVVAWIFLFSAGFSQPLSASALVYLAFALLELRRLPCHLARTRWVRAWPAQNLTYQQFPLPQTKQVYAQARAQEAEAMAAKAAQAVKQGLRSKKSTKYRKSSTFHRPKTLKPERAPKYPRKSAPKVNKLDQFQIIK